MRYSRGLVPTLRRIAYCFHKFDGRDPVERGPRRGRTKRPLDEKGTPMKHLIASALIVGSACMLGCEDKKAPDAAKAVGDMTKSATDAAKAAGDKAAGAMSAATDTLKTEVMAMVEKAKTQIDALTKGGASLTGEKKGEFDKALADITTQFTALKDSAGKLTSQSGDGLMKALNDMKASGGKLMDGIKAAADKFGIKLS